MLHAWVTPHPVPWIDSIQGAGSTSAYDDYSAEEMKSMQLGFFSKTNEMKSKTTDHACMRAYSE
jgi:hypothetical protein